MCRGATRLDSAWVKKQVWRHHIRTWGLSEANVLFWKSAYVIVVTFCPPAVIRRPGNCTPCSPPYVSGVTESKSENFPQINKFASPNIMNFYSMNICNFRTQQAYRMDLAHTANKGYCRRFKFFRVVFVSLLIMPHAFFSAWTCVCFANNKTFENVWFCFCFFYPQ